MTTEINRQLRKSGYRVTPQRQLILDAVCQLGDHVTPEAVYLGVHGFGRDVVTELTDGVQDELALGSYPVAWFA